MATSGVDKFTAMRGLLETTIRSGRASVAVDDRRIAFERPADLGGPRARYCAQVARDANGVTDEDVAALRAEGLDDRQIFEYTVAAAVGEASRQLDSALAALAATTEVGAP